MGTETPVYIEDLRTDWPLAGDSRAKGDDHLRNIKVAVKGSFTSLGQAPVTANAAELNYLDLTNAIGTVTASEAVVVDGAKDIGTFGTVTAATFTGTNVDGILGANTPAAITGTAIVANTSLVANGIVSGTAFTVIDMGSPIDSTLTSVAHGLSSAPKIRCIYLECDSAEKGYSIGDRIWISGFSRGDLHFHADATNLNYWWDTSAEALWDITGGIFQEINGSSPGTFTPASWTIYAEAGL